MECQIGRPQTYREFTYHAYEEPTHERYWVLAFDGGSNTAQACGLVAREQADRYDGFWTDDSDLVEDIRSVLSDGSARDA